MDIRAYLLEHRDPDYKSFTAKLIPNIDPDTMIGVRIPEIRTLAKSIKDDAVIRSFIKELPHKYFEENLLHGLILEKIRDEKSYIAELERFLPYVDNWSVCDTMGCKRLNDEVIIKKWLKADHPYTVRFGIKVLMSNYLDTGFDIRYPKLVADIVFDDYYVNMMRAWYFATALAKQYDSVITFIEGKKLDNWTHNKAIQKAVESYRITDEQKAYLKSLKIS